MLVKYVTTTPIPAPACHTGICSSEACAGKAWQLRSGALQGLARPMRNASISCG